MHKKIVFLLTLFMVSALLFDPAFGDEKKEPKKLSKLLFFKKDKKKPTESEKAPEPAPDGLRQMASLPVPQRPANGALYTSDSQNSELITDFRARRIGDLVFIDVVEASTATVSSSAKRDRDSGNLGGLTTAVGALPINGAAIAAASMGALGTRKYEGKGSTQRTSDLRSRIAARIIEVYPNGDMRIEAAKTVKINHESEKLVLSGIIRARDVTAENVVPTTAVGNLFVELNGKGVASADNAPGWLFRMFEKISPF